MNSRTKNTIINVVVTFGSQFMLAIINLLIRKTIIDYVGIEIFGIEGLFNSIMSLIYTLDLGIASASSYYYVLGISHNNDYQLKITYLAFRRLYRIISCIIIFIDLIILMNLDNFVTSILVDSFTLRIVFVLVSASRLISFYKTPYENLLIYGQKQYIAQMVYLICGVIFSIFKLVFVYIYKSYIIYLFFVFIEGFTVYFFVKRNCFSFLNNENPCIADIKRREKEIIIYGLRIFINGYICGFFVSKDNIIINNLFGTDGLILIAKASNYSTICSTVMTFANSIMSALRASVVNYINDKSVNSEENIINVFSIIFFVTFIMCCFCFIGLFGLSSPFISLLYGKNYLITNGYSFSFAFIASLELFISSLLFYLTGKGKIDKENILLIIDVVITVTISYILVKLLGPLGTYIGTIIGYIIRILFLLIIVSNDLKISLVVFTKKIAIYVVILIFDALVIYLSIDQNVGNILDFVKLTFKCAVLFLLSISFFIKGDDFKSMKHILLNKNKQQQ